MRLADTRAALRRNLAGVRTDWTNEVLDGGVARATDDLDRLIPREVIADFTLVFAVTGEVWASGTLGSTVSLANSRIKPKSETVKDSGGTVTYERDTDYTMDYVLGTITTLAAGSIVDSSNNQIDYTILETYVDLSSLTDLIRIYRVEYPGGQVPSDFQSFYTWGDLLAITSSGTQTQQRLSAGEHVWVYYHAKHTTPDKDTDATWLPQLDEVIIKGAVSYCLETKAMELRHSVRTRQVSVVTALGEIAAIVAQMDTALTNTATQASSAVADMASIDTHISSMVSTLDAVGGYLTNAASAITLAQSQLALSAGDILEADSPAASALSRLGTISALISAVTDTVNEAKTMIMNGSAPLKAADASLDTIYTSIGVSDAELPGVDTSRSQARSFLAQGILTLANADTAMRVDGKGVLNLLGTDITDPIPLVGDNIDAAGNRLISGLAVLDQVNIGEIVSEMYRRYAETWIAAGRLRYDEFLSLLGQVDRYVAVGQGINNVASGWRNHAETYLAEGNLIIGHVSALLAKISAYHDNISKEIDVAQGFVSIGRALSESGGVAVGNAGRAIEEANSYTAVARLRLEASDSGVRIAETQIASAVQHISTAQTKIAEGTALQSIIDAILNRVAQKVEVSKVYQGEADRRLQQLGYKLQEADRFTALATQESELADKFEITSVRTKGEFMAILMDRSQVRIESALSPTRQQAPA